MRVPPPNRRRLHPLNSILQFNSASAEVSAIRWLPRCRHSTRFNGTKASMTGTNLKSVADEQVLYLTTVGRSTGLPREIEIWFVVWCERLYVFAETREAAEWVRNIRRNPEVTVRTAEW